MIEHKFSSNEMKTEILGKYLYVINELHRVSNEFVPVCDDGDAADLVANTNDWCCMIIREIVRVSKLFTEEERREIAAVRGLSNLLIRVRAKLSVNDKWAIGPIQHFAEVCAEMESAESPIPEIELCKAVVSCTKYLADQYLCDFPVGDKGTSAMRAF